MEFIINKLLKMLDVDKYSEIEQMKLKLGLQVLCHNIWMTTVILGTTWYLGIFHEALILFLSYGILKMQAGGIHFQKSWQCLLVTSGFIIAGVFIAKHIELSSIHIVLLYIFCLLLLWAIGPQGTKNNPISKTNHLKLRRNSLLIVNTYLLLTLSGILSVTTSYILLIAVVFETLSIIPNKIQNSHCTS